MKRLLSYDFQFVQNIEPVLDRSGLVQEFRPQEKYVKKDLVSLHHYGYGTFCRFSIDPSKWAGVSGVYAFFIDDELVYIGQALDLAQRFNQGYGFISPRSCYQQGQSTNCKINKVVLEAKKSDKQISLYFYTTGNFHQIERDLIECYNPLLNFALRTDHVAISQYDTSQSRQVNTRKRSNRRNGVTNNPSTHEVREFIQSQMLSALAQGKHELIVRSGEIHTVLKMSKALPTVCRAMRTLPTDYKFIIIEQPPKGNGSRLVIKYLF